MNVRIPSSNISTIRVKPMNNENRNNKNKLTYACNCKTICNWFSSFKQQNLSLQRILFCRKKNLI